VGFKMPPEVVDLPQTLHAKGRTLGVICVALKSRVAVSLSPSRRPSSENGLVDSKIDAV
jgi:hypothetical protein